MAFIKQRCNAIAKMQALHERLTTLCFVLQIYKKPYKLLHFRLNIFVFQKTEITF